ncbi:MAG: chromate efflux transporter [Leptospiraceae bacterium]|nr:chromate efflux transporter [Leptospiraceae bacterium]
MSERNNNERQPSAPGFITALKFWLKLGFISFGGPAGQISIMHEFLVEKQKWISNSRFMHALNFTMLLPGPEAQQLATYCGYLLHGKKGGFAAGVLFILPSLVLLILLSILYSLYSSRFLVKAVFAGIQPAIVAVIAVSLYRLSRKALTSLFHYTIAALSFSALFWGNIPFPIVIFGCLLSGILYARFVSLSNSRTSNSISLESENDVLENQFYINANSKTEFSSVQFTRIFKQTLLTICLWISVFLILRACMANALFWSDLYLFFTQAALITFGGAYAVLPYVASTVVHSMHWLSSQQMLDGLALGESTPGPLVMVLVFVGYMAAFQVENSSVSAGIMGACIVTFVTFLPSFFFIITGASLVEKIRENQKVQIALQFISAGITGVILNLAVYFGRNVLFTNQNHDFNFFAAVWILISIGVLLRWRINLLLWILISSIAGLLHYY